MGIKICIALITNRGVRPKTVGSLMEMIASTKYKVVPIVAERGYTIAENRAFAVIQAQKHGCSHILFIDDDMVFPEDTLERLLGNGAEVVGVYSYSRALPLTPTVMFLDERGEYLPHDKIAKFPKPDHSFQVYAIGLGVALINMKVFEKIERPWFEFKNHESGKNLVGEDAWFCDKAREKEIDIWCDPTINIGHLGEYNYGTA